MHLRWVTSPKCRLLFGLMCLMVFIYTKIDLLINDESQIGVTSDDNVGLGIEMAPRSHCQIIYIMGVEGSVHHGFTPILHSLALKQHSDDGHPIDVQLQPRALRAALFGRFREKRTLDDPSLVADTLTKLCPMDGRRHVIIEDSSFPCGQEGDPRGYRFPRQHFWLNMTKEEIASSALAIEHPVNLYKFVELYGVHAEIKFIVLHRPFLETIASHMDWDESIVRHSNLIRGFMLILRRFLDVHDAKKEGKMAWTIVCVERLMSQSYQYESEKGTQIDYEAWNAARQHIISHLIDFLGWTQKECNDCFDYWKEGSNKMKAIKEDDLVILLDHMKAIEGVWPPALVLQGGEQEKQCST